MATSKLTAVVQTKGAKRSADDLRRFSKSANDAEMGSDGAAKGNKKLSASFSKLGGAVGIAIKTITAAATGTIAFTTAIAIANRDLGILAAQAKTTTQDFRALSFATAQYGINADQIADISKDVADKVGEFATAGTGAFQDYVDVIGLTKEESAKLAQEFQGLSSQDVIGRVVSGLEGVNATSGQTTFVLESLGNDLSRLAPLFASNSSELVALKARFDEVNGSLALTSAQSGGLQQLTQDYSLLTSSLKSSASLIAATLAPVVSDFFVGVTDLVPKATQTIVDFFNTFQDAKNITSTQSIINEIKEITERLAGAEKLRDEGRITRSDVYNAKVLEEKTRLSELQSQLETLTNQEQKLADARKTQASAISIGSGGGSFGKIEAEIELEKQKKQKIEALKIEQLNREKEIAQVKIADFVALNNTELEEVKRREEERLGIIASFREMGLVSVKDFDAAKTEIELSASEDRIDIAKKEADQKAAAAKRERAQRIGAAQGALADLQTIGGKESKTAKRAAKASALISTYQAANSAYASLASIPFVGPALGAAAAGLAISAGLANVKAIDAAREQGGQFNANQNILVGERGPEVVNFAQSGRVSNDTSGQMASPNVSLVVIDQSEGKKEFDESRDDDGRIVLLIRNTVASDIAAPNSSISKSLASSTGARRSGR